MAAKNFQNYSNFIKIGLYGFFGSLTMDPLLVFQIRDDGSNMAGENFLNYSNFMKIEI